VSRCFSSYARQ